MTRTYAGVFSFLIGQSCWGIVAGSGTGSMVRLLLGKMIKREKPVNNPNLTSAVRDYDAEISIFVECGWRLSAGKDILCNSTSSNLAGEEMLIGLNRLEQQVIKDISFNPDTLDFSMSFANGCCFSVFNDLPSSQSSYGSYSIRTLEKRYTADQFNLITQAVG